MLILALKLLEGKRRFRTWQIVAEKMEVKRRVVNLSQVNLNQVSKRK